MARFPPTNTLCEWPSQRPRGRTFPSAQSSCATAHGEMAAIGRFAAARPAAELQGTTLYTSGEPCPMCMSAILSRGIDRLVFVASINELATKLAQIVPTSRQVAEAAPFAAIAIAGGVLPAEALALFPQ